MPGVVRVANSPKQHTSLDAGYLSLPALAIYAGVSRRTLQAFLSDPVDPLPYIVLPGMTAKRVKRSVYDAWAARYQRRGTDDAATVDRVVREVLGQRDVVTSHR